jgi:hypothetical protein
MKNVGVRYFFDHMRGHINIKECETVTLEAVKHAILSDMALFQLPKAAAHTLRLAGL